MTSGNHLLTWCFMTHRGLRPQLWEPLCKAGTQTLIKCIDELIIVTFLSDAEQSQAVPADSAVFTEACWRLNVGGESNKDKKTASGFWQKQQKNCDVGLILPSQNNPTRTQHREHAGEIPSCRKGGARQLAPRGRGQEQISGFSCFLFFLRKKTEVKLVGGLLLREWVKILTHPFLPADSETRTQTSPLTWDTFLRGWTSRFWLTWWVCQLGLAEIIHHRLAELSPNNWIFFLMDTPSKGLSSNFSNAFF